VVGLLYDANGDGIGVMVDGHKDVEVYAKRWGKPISEIHHGRFRQEGNRIIKSQKGIPVTYSSTVGPIDMANVVDLDEVPDDHVYIFKDDAGGLHAFPSIEEAVIGNGFPREALINTIPTANAIILASLKNDMGGEMGAAIKKMYDEMEG